MVHIMGIKTGYESIAEKRIRTAMEQGEFDNLPGHGKPLEFEDDSNIPEDLRLSYKILKNADCVPVELELNAEIRQVEDLLKDMTDVNEIYRATKRLGVLKRKMALNRRSDREIHIPEDYETSVVERLDKNKGHSGK